MKFLNEIVEFIKKFSSSSLNDILIFDIMMIIYAEIFLSVILLFTTTNSINFYFLTLINLYYYHYYIFDIHINMNLFMHML